MWVISPIRLYANPSGITVRQWIIDMSASYKTMLIGGAVGFWAWVESINWLGLIGTLIALGGLLVNFYFQCRKDKREQRESEARIDAMLNRKARRKTDFPGTDFRDEFDE